MSKLKQEIITFKAEESLAAILKGIANRSDFIRNAILKSLENVCPLCQGTGYLNPEQKGHWMQFAEHHAVKHCKQCDSLYLECDARRTRVHA